MPAIADGKALWPAWYDLAALERIKATIGPREWSALYQQRPQPDEGRSSSGNGSRLGKMPTVRYYAQVIMPLRMVAAITQFIASGALALTVTFTVLRVGADKLHPTNG